MFGVPPLLNKISGAVASVTLLASTLSSIFNALFGITEWGIFGADGAGSAVSIDSVVELTQNKQSSISDYRVEEGSFASYNKVERPRQITVRISKGGSAGERAAVMEWVEEMTGAIDMFDVVTPEKAYINMTLIGYSNKREAKQGVTVLYVDCTFQEVRETEPEYSDSKEDTGADTKNAADAGDKPSTKAAKVQPTEFKGGGGQFSGKGASGDW